MKNYKNKQNSPPKRKNRFHNTTNTKTLLQPPKKNIEDHQSRWKPPESIQKAPKKTKKDDEPTLFYRLFNKKKTALPSILATSPLLAAPRIFPPSRKSTSAKQMAKGWEMGEPQSPKTKVSWFCFPGDFLSLRPYYLIPFGD